MRRQVRRSTFETNSSSMHSLVVTKNNEYFTQEEIEKDIWLFDGTIDGKDMDYGRSPFRVLYGLKDKAMYAIASLCEYKDETYNRICNVIRSYLPGFKDFDLDFDTKVWTDDISEKELSHGMEKTTMLSNVVIGFRGDLTWDMSMKIS